MARRMRVAITTAQMRERARRHVRNFSHERRHTVAWLFLEHLATDPEFFYTTAQIKAAAEGLRLGMSEPVGG